MSSIPGRDGYANLRRGSPYGLGGSILVSRAPDTRGSFVCDGTADEVQINDALAYTAALGGSVVLLEGSYSIDAAITLTVSNQALLGVGDATQIVTSGNFNAIEVSGIAADNRITGILVAHLAVVGTGAGAGNGVQCTYVDDSLIFDVTATTFGGDGIYQDDCDWCFITNCSVIQNTDGIHVTGLGTNNSITGNIARLNSSTGIHSECYHTTIVSNSCEDNEEYGIRVHTATDQHVVGNDCVTNLIAGILLQSNYSVCTGNMLARNGQIALIGNPGGYNIYVNGATFSAITGNESNHAIGGATRTGYGIYVVDSRDTVISGNMCEENGLTGVGDGIILQSSDYMTIDGNSCHLNLRYGINISNAGCDENLLGVNYLRANGTAPFNDVGTNTWLPTLVFQFQQGGDEASGIVAGNFIHATASAKGWEIDAATEWAIALGWLPLKVQQVLRIKIYAVGLAAPGAGNNMRLEINVNAGIDDEAYTAEAIAVANHPNVTANFAVDDVIYWMIDASDDADIGDLIGGDSFEVKVIHEAAGNGDIATDAVFRTVAIEYV